MHHITVSSSRRTLAGVLFTALLAQPAMAFIPVALPGVSSFDGWANSTVSTYLSSANYPAYSSGSLGGPGGAWPGPVAANLPSSDGGAQFMKTAGSGYFAGSGVYTAGGQGSFSVFDLAPLTNLETIVFQFEVNFNNPLLGAFTPPTLSYNSGSQHLTAGYTQLIPNSGIVVSSNAVYAYQWDLTGVTDPITAFSLDWIGPPSSGQITGLRLNQGDTFAQAVPEPATWGLLIGAASIGLVAFQRRRAKARQLAC